MKENTVVAFQNPSDFQKDPLTEVLQAGARELLAQAVEAEVSVFLGSHAALVDAAGRRRVVRNGYLPERFIQTGIGLVSVRQPRVRDRGDGAIRFTSAILPRYLRRAKSLEDLLPWLYLKGISTGDFGEALAALLGSSAPGLSASTITRLKEVWGVEAERWQRRDLTASRAFSLSRRTTSLSSRRSSVRSDLTVSFWSGEGSRTVRRRGGAGHGPVAPSRAFDAARALRSRAFSLRSAPAVSKADAMPASERSVSRRATSACKDGTSLAVRRASFVSSTASLSLRRQALNRDFHEPPSLRAATSAQRSSSARASAASLPRPLAVASAVETVALRLPTRCGDRADAAHHGEARLGAEPIRVIPNGDHYCACVLGAHAFELKQTGGELLDHRTPARRSIPNGSATPAGTLDHRSSGCQEDETSPAGPPWGSSVGEPVAAHTFRPAVPGADDRDLHRAMPQTQPNPLHQRHRHLGCISPSPRPPPSSSACTLCPPVSGPSSRPPD